MTESKEYQEAVEITARKLKLASVQDIISWDNGESNIEGQSCWSDEKCLLIAHELLQETYSCKKCRGTPGWIFDTQMFRVECPDCKGTGKGGRRMKEPTQYVETCRECHKLFSSPSRYTAVCNECRGGQQEELIEGLAKLINKLIKDFDNEAHEYPCLLLSKYIITYLSSYGFVV